MWSMQAPMQALLMDWMDTAFDFPYCAKGSDPAYQYSFQPKILPNPILFIWES